MASLGYYLLLAAFVACAYAAAMSVAGARRRSLRLVESGIGASYLMTAIMTVASSVMTFERNGLTFNLLDTPGHEDFSEDTYRTLTAVDSAVMVIDAAKVIEARTRKLFEICRLRDIPIVTFINKIDRESRDPIELLDEIASAARALAVMPKGRNFQ